jgi:alpha-tubulin suppressor-like RCC1 family protein
MEKSKVHEPQEIKGLKNERITKVICGGTFTFFQSETGDLFACGMNDLG